MNGYKENYLICLNKRSINFLGLGSVAYFISSCIAILYLISNIFLAQRRTFWDSINYLVMSILVLYNFIISWNFKIHSWMVFGDKGWVWGGEVNKMVRLTGRANCAIMKTRMLSWWRWAVQLIIGFWEVPLGCEYKPPGQLVMLCVICHDPVFLAGLVVWVLGTLLLYSISSGGHGTMWYSMTQHELLLIQIPIVSSVRTEWRVLVLL